MKKTVEKPLALIVEDSLVELELLKRSVIKGGYEVAAARNGFEALESIMARKPAVVLSDINMPRMNGFEMCAAIRRNKAIRDLPVILISFLSEPEDVIMAVDAGADGYMTKPYDEDVLLSRIKALLSAPAVGMVESEETMEIEYKGKRFTVPANSRRLMNITLSVYENLISQNRLLANMQLQLTMLNERLEEKVRERTLSLTKEIEERVKTEEALRESEARHRAIMETASDAMICIDPAGKVHMWNKKAEEMFGYSEKEAVGAAIHALVTPERHRGQATAGLERFSSSGEGPFLNKMVEITAIRKDGSEFPVELSIAPVKMRGGWGASAIIRDITARKEWERTLTETNEKLRHALDDIKKTQKMLIRSEKLAALGQLAAGVGHELKNPLSIIYTSTQLMMMEEGISADVAESCKTIMEQVTRAVKIIENLRDFARERKPETKAINLAAFIKKTLSLVEYEMRGEGIEITVEEPPEPIRIMGDEDQLAQVFLNLTSNARDSLNTKKKRLPFEIREKIGWKAKFFVRLKTEDGKAKIVFDDNGVGISEENQKKLFTPFFTTKSETTGTGLGAAIALGIVENHGGFIEFQSEEGEGATFTVTLPLAGE